VDDAAGVPRLEEAPVGGTRVAVMVVLVAVTSVPLAAHTSIASMLTVWPE